MIASIELYDKYLDANEIKTAMERSKKLPSSNSENCKWNFVKTNHDFDQNKFNLIAYINNEIIVYFHWFTRYALNQKYDEL